MSCMPTSTRQMTVRALMLLILYLMILSCLQLLFAGAHRRRSQLP